MRNKLILWAILVLAGFLVGFFIEYPRLTQARAQLSSAEGQIASERLNVETTRLRETAALIYFEVARRNYGSAADLANRFFSDAATLSTQTNDAALRTALDKAMQLRDPMMTGLAKADPQVLATAQDLVSVTQQQSRQ